MVNLSPNCPTRPARACVTMKNTWLISSRCARLKTTDEKQGLHNEAMETCRQSGFGDGLALARQPGAGGRARWQPAFGVVGRAVCRHPAVDCGHASGGSMFLAPPFRQGGRGLGTGFSPAF